MNNFFIFDYIFPMGNWWYPFHYENDPVNETLRFEDENTFFDTLNTNSNYRSLYFHIPFCEDTICKFCMLPKKLKETDKEIENYVEALIKEIKYKGKYSFLKTNSIKSIFFGGGSPSILSVEQIKRLGHAIRETFILDELEEFSFEMNAKHVTEDKVKALRDIGVTHGRIGVQTFSPSYREKFGVTPSFEDIKRSINLFKKYFKYSSIDLIYGMFEFSIEDLIRDINTAINLSPDLIDYYPITNSLTNSNYTDQFNTKNITALSKISSNIIIRELFEMNGYYPHNGHGFIKVKKDDNNTTYRKYKFKYHYSLYGLKGCDIVGFGAFANTQLDGYIISNPPLKKYLEDIQNGGLDFHYVEYNTDLLDEKGIICHLPYFGYIEKENIEFNKLSSNIKKKIKILKEYNLIKEDEYEYSLTKLGWFWYVNIFFFLMPQIDQEWIIEFISNNGSEEKGEKWKNLKFDYNDVGDDSNCLNLKVNI